MRLDYLLNPPKQQQQPPQQQQQNQESQTQQLPQQQSQQSQNQNKNEQTPEEAIKEKETEKQKMENNENNDNDDTQPLSQSPQIQRQLSQQQSQVQPQHQNQQPQQIQPQQIPQQSQSQQNPQQSQQQQNQQQSPLNQRKSRGSQRGSQIITEISVSDLVGMIKVAIKIIEKGLLVADGVDSMDFYCWLWSNQFTRNALKSDKSTVNLMHFLISKRLNIIPFLDNMQTDMILDTLKELPLDDEIRKRMIKDLYGCFVPQVQLFLASCESGATTELIQKFYKEFCFAIKALRLICKQQQDFQLLLKSEMKQLVSVVNQTLLKINENLKQIQQQQQSQQQQNENFDQQEFEKQKQLVSQHLEFLKSIDRL